MPVSTASVREPTLPRSQVHHRHQRQITIHQSIPVFLIFSKSSISEQISSESDSSVQANTPSITSLIRLHHNTQTHWRTNYSLNCSELSAWLFSPETVLPGWRSQRVQNKNSLNGAIWSNSLFSSLSWEFSINSQFIFFSLSSFNSCTFIHLNCLNEHTEAALSACLL